MSFKTINIKRTRRLKNRFKDEKLQKIIIYWIISFITFCFIFILFIYIKFIVTLPSIEKLEQLDLKKSSVIYDKEWTQLYTLSWDEKRTYVDYSKISKHMVNAIVAWEDNTFFENSWIDYLWIFRAVFNRIIWKTADIKWTSTISQQLIKNVFLSNERSYERKIKEAYLSFRMNQKYSKEKILELYLNKIWFWSNIYWVEQASRTYFWKPIKDISIVEASILASLPKWPTFYSLYNYPYRVLGYVYHYNQADDTNKIKIYTEQDLIQSWDMVKKIYDIVKNYKWTKIWDNGIFICWMNKDDYKNKLKIDNDGCLITQASELEYILNSIQVKDNWEFIEYQTWRKDYILSRMLWDWYITFDEFKDAYLKWFGFKINQKIENIKHPHFVMYIKEYLSEKYWEDLIEWWWLKIYTSLDPKLQQKAEEIVTNQVNSNKTKYWSNNGALISIDNTNWDILAFVWWANYYDKTIDGQVNMITSKRQPGSTFKPFVYALAIDKNPIWPQTPIFDLKTTFPWNYEPKNFDWKFMGKMNVMTALNYSRNIPAIKAYFLAWEQKWIIEYMKTAWVKSLKDNFYYWAPLALWAWEMTPLELVWAYSVFANLWNKVEINPILKILDSNWLVIEEKKKSSWVRVLDEKTAYIINNILSNTNSRPSSFWNNALTLNWRTVAAKTWTSNKLVVKNWTKTYFPWDLWTAWYTPQITTVVWAWNTNWKQINTSWDWLNWAAPIWKQYMEFAHLYREKQNWVEPKWTIHATISKLSWLLAPSWFNPSFMVSTIFKNKPKSYDNSLKYIEVDEMCNWKVTEKTPVWAIKKWYYVELRDIDPNNQNWQRTVMWRLNNWWWEREFWNIPNIITSYRDIECDRNQNLIDNATIEINADINETTEFLNWDNQVNVSYKSNNPLRKIQFLLWDNIVWEQSIENEKIWDYNWTFNVPSWYDWEYKLTIRVIDSIYYSAEKTYNIKISSKDTIPPTINVTNPARWKISIYEDQFFNLRFKVFDNSSIKSVNIYINDKPYKLWLKDIDNTIKINDENNISVWLHSIKIEAIDFSFNKWDTTVELEVLKR